MIPAPRLDRLISLLAWLAERIAAIREQAALRDQAGDDQDPAMAALLTAAPAPAGLDARGGARGLLPASRLRHRPVILVPGACANAPQAAAGYAGARSKHVSMTDIIALSCLPATCGRDKRPVWRGCVGLRLSDGTQIRG